MQYINVTGVTSSGSSAVVDLLKEYSCIGSYEKEYTYEHIFLCHPEGLFETEQILETHFFGLHTDVAIRRFIQKANDVLNSFGGNSFWSTTQKEKYLQCVRRYIDSICDKEGEYVSCVEEMNYWRRKIEMISIILKRNNIVRKIYPQKYGWYTLKVCKNDLRMYTRKLFYDYLDIVTCGEEKKEYYLFDGLVSLTNITYLKEIGVKDIKNIIVLRDPRDRYLGEMLIKDSGEGIAVVPTDAELYCKNYKVAMELLKEQNLEECCIVWFEDLILKYDETVRKIERYLNIGKEMHDTNIGQKLNLSISCKNCRLYERDDLKTKYYKPLSIIKDKLGKYLYHNN